MIVPPRPIHMKNIDVDIAMNVVVKLLISCFLLMHYEMILSDQGV